MFFIFANNKLCGSFITIPATDYKHKGELNILTYNINIIKIII